MTLWLGLDVGTSAVKAVIVDDDGQLRSQAEAGLSIARPQPLWSEQEPEHWWQAVGKAIRALPADLRAGVAGIGLAGQMHGAVLLDRHDRPLRPAILWNDGRAAAECAELERAEPRSRAITGNRAMAGFTAPKLLWVRNHEPEVFRAVETVLLPKDYVRLRLTGEKASDMSDSAGSLWVDLAERRWSEAMLAATGLHLRHMPALHEGNEVTGRLSADVAAELGLPCVPVAAGAGDNAGAAVGLGLVDPGQALLSLGTSGVLFVADDGVRTDCERGVHAFCHAVPGRWHRMAVILSAAACLDWVARLAGFASVEAALEAASHRDALGLPIFLPYLSGERTPHDNPHAQGVFFGLTRDTDGAALVRAVLEGVAFALADGAEALRASGGALPTLTLAGGGTRSPHWGRILASVLDASLDYRSDAAVGPALGAAKLAHLAVAGAAISQVCRPPPLVGRVDPEPALREQLAPRLALFRRLYPALKTCFPLEITP